MFRSHWFRNGLNPEMKSMHQLSDWNTSKAIKNVMSGFVQAQVTTMRNDLPAADSGPPCENRNSYRQCEDGSCIPEVDLCPDEQLMNQNTILIMIVVGLAVVIFLIVLYCFQQRQRTPTHRSGTTGFNGNCDDEQDRLSLFVPPPPYNEAVNTEMYPPTPQMPQRREPLTSFDEPPPLTPPPNYDMALTILARSHESILNAKSSIPRRQSSGNLVRRSVSMDGLNNQCRDNSAVIHLGEISEMDNRKTEFSARSEDVFPPVSS